jgi:hypothetical protein
MEIKPTVRLLGVRRRKDHSHKHLALSLDIALNPIPAPRVNHVERVRTMKYRHRWYQI